MPPVPVKVTVWLALADQLPQTAAKPLSGQLAKLKLRLVIPDPPPVAPVKGLAVVPTPLRVRYFSSQNDVPVSAVPVILWAAPSVVGL